MIDLTTKTIKRLFQERIMDITKKTVIPKEETFDYQLSGGWLR